MGPDRTIPWVSEREKSYDTSLSLDERVQMLFGGKALN
jgi:hypothetical protein